jgi:hypothetical protein
MVHQVVDHMPQQTVEQVPEHLHMHMVVYLVPHLPISTYRTTAVWSTFYTG